jgi:hypothetical protein
VIRKVQNVVHAKEVEGCVNLDRLSPSSGRPRDNVIPTSLESAKRDEVLGGY